jgi:hypothetical protein
MLATGVNPMKHRDCLIHARLIASIANDKGFDEQRLI